MIILQITLSIVAVIALILLGVFLMVYTHKTSFEQAYTKTLAERFLVVPTALEIYENDDADNEISEDLRKLMGRSAQSDIVKRVNTTTIIDLDEVFMLHQWSTSNFEDEKIVADCTMITFKSGDQLLVLETINALEDSLARFLAKRSKL